MNILEASQAAQVDTFIVQFLTDHIGVDMDRAGMMLDEFRQWRKRREE